MAPPATGEWKSVIRWNTDARIDGAPVYPNGRYQLALRMVVNGAAVVTGDSVSVIVSNP